VAVEKRYGSKVWTKKNGRVYRDGPDQACPKKCAASTQKGVLIGLSLAGLTQWLWKKGMDQRYGPKKMDECTGMGPTRLVPISVRSARRKEHGWACPWQD
jgi:hypothetical protein